MIEEFKEEFEAIKNRLVEVEEATEEIEDIEAITNIPGRLLRPQPLKSICRFANILLSLTKMPLKQLKDRTFIE